MYERGRRVKGYAKKRLHKRKLKKQFLEHLWGYPQYKSYKDYLANHKPLWDPDSAPNTRYWQKVYVSGCRKLAKDQTNRKIRRRYKTDIQKGEYEMLPAIKGAGYRKYYDYWWTVW